jgi:hypothetical protein
VAVVAQLNARTLSGVIAVDIEDFGVAWGNARGIRVEPKGKGPPRKKGYFVKLSKSILLEEEMR